MRIWKVNQIRTTHSVISFYISSDADLIGFLDGLRISRAKTDWWEELPEVQPNEILAGLKDAESGKVMDAKEFWAILKLANLFPDVESNYHSQLKRSKNND